MSRKDLAGTRDILFHSGTVPAFGNHTHYLCLLYILYTLFNATYPKTPNITLQRSGCDRGYLFDTCFRYILVDICIDRWQSDKWHCSHSDTFPRSSNRMFLSDRLKEQNTDIIHYTVSPLRFSHSSRPVLCRSVICKIICMCLDC